MVVTRQITLDVYNNDMPVEVRAVQGDNESRYLNITLTAGPNKIFVDSAAGDLAMFRGHKPDNTYFDNFGTVESDGTVTVEFTSQILAAFGQINAEITIQNGNSVLTTAQFKILVQKSNLGINEIESSDEFGVLNDLVSDAVEVIEDVEAWAVGTRGGVPVPSTDPNYHNNSKYYSEQSYKNAEAWAVGERGGTPVPSSDPTYHNNSKYWAEQSAESAASVDVHTDGNYPEMTVGTAEALIGDLISEDDATYILRPTPVDAKRKSVKVTGATVAFNQLVVSNYKSGSKTFESDTSTYQYHFYSNISSNKMPVYNGHKYFVSVKITRSFSTNDGVNFITRVNNGTNFSIQVANGSADGYYSGIFEATADSYVQYITINNYLYKKGYNVGDTFAYDDYVLFDLTLMFGSTIADALYAMEQAQAESGIAFLKSHGFFTEPYYDYDAGSLLSVNPTAHKIVGLNQEEHAYALNAATTQNPSGDLRGLFKIVNGELVADGDEYTSDGKVARKYLPSINLGNLNWNLNSGTQYYATYSGEGAVDTRDGIVSNGKYSIGAGAYSNVDKCLTVKNTLIWITDSDYSTASELKTALANVYLVVKRNMPTEEQATPYADPMISLADGTEEWDSPIPVYTEADYFNAVTSEDIKTMQGELIEKIYDTLPTDKITNAPIASFPDGADNVPVKSATFGIDPVQDLHGYDSPWPASGRGNYLPCPNDGSQTEAGVTVSVKNGVYTVKGTASADIVIAFSLKEQVDMSPSLNNIHFFNSVANDVNMYFRRGAIIVHYWAMSTIDRVATSWTDSGNEVIDTVAFGVPSGRVVDMTISPMFVRKTDTAPTEFIPWENICPITGFTGAEITQTGANCWGGQLFANDVIASCNSSVTQTGNVVKLPSGAGNVNSSTADRAHMFENHFQSGQYTIFIGQPNDTTSTNEYSLISVFYTDGTAVSINNSYYDAASKRWRFVSDANKTISHLRMNKDRTSLQEYDITKMGVFRGNVSAADFTSYVGTTHEITWQDEAGTVYSGTLKYLGGDAWRLTANREYKVCHSGDVDTTSNPTGYGAIALGTFEYSDDNIMPLCNVLKKWDGTASTIPNYHFNVFNSPGYNRSQMIIRLPFTSSTQTEQRQKYNDWLGEMETAGTPLTVCFGLATPITYDLTGEELATVLGTNNVFSSTGNVTELVYRADVAKYIEKKLSA